MSEKVCEICGRKIIDEEFPAGMKVGFWKSGVPRVVFDPVCNDCIPEAKRRIRGESKKMARRSVWHPAKEEPQFPEGSDVVKLAVLDRPKKYDRLHHGYFSRKQDWKQEVIENQVQRWAYFEELMSL